MRADAHRITSGWSMKSIRPVAILLCGLLLAFISAQAQSVTGRVSGMVTDPTDSPIAGATVQLANSLTKQVRTITTETSGGSIFADLMPGDYHARHSPWLQG